MRILNHKEVKKMFSIAIWELEFKNGWSACNAQCHNYIIKQEHSLAQHFVGLIHQHACFDLSFRNQISLFCALELYFKEIQCVTLLCCSVLCALVLEPWLGWQWNKRTDTKGIIVLSPSYISLVPCYINFS